MLPNSAYHLVPIVQGVNYNPTAQTMDLVNPNTGLVESPAIQVPNGITPPIYAIMCTTTNTGNTIIKCLGDTSTVTFPAGSFIQGVVYYIYLGTITTLGGATFVGFQYIANPQVY